MKNCTFVGHRDIQATTELTNRIIVELTRLISEHEVTNFYCGYHGAFDMLCASIVIQLKQLYPHIKLYGVTAYISPNNTARNKYISSMCDELIYPPIEGTPYRYAIPTRNRWMIQQCQYVLAYIDYTFGGAYTSIVQALCGHHDITNFGKHTLTKQARQC